MKAVGLRELKNRLSEYVRQVRMGDVFLVTDRSEVVAELRPPGSARISEPQSALAALAQRGLVRPGAPNKPELYATLPAVLRRGNSQALLDLERGDR